MNAKHRRTLAAVFETPVRADLPWRDVEALFAALGAEISEGSGSRIRVALDGVRAVFHRPHPRPTAAHGAVRAARRFLLEAGIER